MSWRFKIKPGVMLLHIAMWSSVWFFFVFFFSYNYSNQKYILWFSSLLMPLTVGLTYFTIYFLIPRFLLAKKYFKFGLYSFYLMVFASYQIVLLLYGCLFFILKYDVSNMPPMGKNFVFIMILVYLIVALASFVHLLNHSFATSSKNKELQNKILEARLQLKEQELYYLRSQIHPHFLFNTLNTIYGFALKQSKQTPEIILKLSNLLDYILYHVNKPKVSLSDEILHIKEYIGLEKVRFQDTLKVIFIVGDFGQDLQVAPMILIPFFENAFKHGELIEGYLRIEAKVEIINSQLHFSIRNSIQGNDSKKDGNGIGLANIRKRLDLFYGSGYSLVTEPVQDWYQVKLSIYNLNPAQHE